MRKAGAMRAVLDCSLLESFVRVADVGNISAAARSLFIAQSAVSAQMSVLSRAAGAPLLERVNGRWDLTAAGAVFYKRANELLRKVEELERELAGSSGRIAGHITLASTRTIADTVLASIVAGFAAAHPDVRFDVVAGDRQDAERRLAAGDVDGALVAMPMTGRGLRVHVFSEDRVVLVVPATHLLAGRTSIDFAECANAPFVIFERGSGVRALLEEKLGERFDALDVRLELESNDALLRCVEEGIGLTFLPERVVRRWRSDAPLATVALSDVALTRELALVVSDHRAVSPALATFDAWLRTAYLTPSHA